MDNIYIVSSNAQAETGRKERIVIVDDSITIQKLVNLTLAGLNFEVIGSMDGHDALIKVRRLKPSIVLSDSKLQDMSGIELCEEIRKDTSLLDTRVVLLRGSVGEEEFAAIDQAPSDAVIDKPFDSKKLLSVVQSLLKMEDQSTQVRAPQTQEELAAEEAALQDDQEETVTKAQPEASLSDDEETETKKADGLFSSYRKADEVLSLDDRLASIAAEVAPSSFSQPTPFETIEDRLAGGGSSVSSGDETGALEEAQQVQAAAMEVSPWARPEQKDPVVSDEDESQAAENLEEALSNVDPDDAATNDIASHGSAEDQAMEQLAEKEVRAWLEKNLRPMVEKIVKEELAKMTEE